MRARRLMLTVSRRLLPDQLASSGCCLSRKLQQQRFPCKTGRFKQLAAMQQGLGMMQMQTEAMELKPRMAMQQLPPSLLQERTVSMCQKAVSLKLAAALKQTKASWAGEQITAGTSLGTKLFLRHLLAMVSWTQVVFAQGSCRVSPTCILIGQEQSAGIWKHHLATDRAAAGSFRTNLSVC